LFREQAQEKADYITESDIETSLRRSRDLRGVEDTQIVDLDFSDIDHFIASFGNHLDVDHAIAIGLIPNMPRTDILRGEYVDTNASSSPYQEASTRYTSSGRHYLLRSHGRRYYVEEFKTRSFSRTRTSSSPDDQM
jgi:hypothetical protein